MRGIIPAYAGSTPAPPSTGPTRRDHPRIRGEHSISVVLSSSPAGSSPHTRGARRKHCRGRRPGRIIPAYAGSTPCGTIILTEDRDHPRIRGEHTSVTSRRSCAWGSSPHTRGALRRGQHHHGEQRIIPAYAGSTAYCSSAASRRRDHPRIRGEHRLRRQCRHSGVVDHPRIRGEHVSNSDDGTMPYGSSPHTRGAPFIDGADQVLAGIIPAYAGSTYRRCRRRRRGRDHPRIRGEHESQVYPVGVNVGSSPHTRGARLPIFKFSPRTGIIPAYAGSTSKSSPQTPPGKDHPRIRGEHTWSSSPFETPGGSSPHTRGAPFVSRSLHILMHGSSPHTRGAPCRVVFKAARQRIIPAYAGSTERTTDTLSRSSDHPRIRGEHKSASMLERRPPGSSPHTRGAPRRRCSASSIGGIIPAYAGSTLLMWCAGHP